MAGSAYQALCWALCMLGPICASREDTRGSICGIRKRLKPALPLSMEQAFTELLS